MCFKQKLSFLKKRWRYLDSSEVCGPDCNPVVVLKNCEPKLAIIVFDHLKKLSGLWAHCWNVTSLSLFYRHYFGRCSSELAQLVPLPYSCQCLLVILIDCMIFLSPFLDVARISMSTVSFLAQPDSGIFCLQNAFLWPMI